MSSGRCVPARLYLIEYTEVKILLRFKEKMNSFAVSSGMIKKRTGNRIIRLNGSYKKLLGRTFFSKDVFITDFGKGKKEFCTLVATTHPNHV